MNAPTDSYVDRLMVTIMTTNLQFAFNLNVRALYSSCLCLRELNMRRIMGKRKRKRKKNTRCKNAGGRMPQMHT